MKTARDLQFTTVPASETMASVTVHVSLVTLEAFQRRAHELECSESELAERAFEQISRDE
jgi:hypothetical protein